MIDYKRYNKNPFKAHIEHHYHAWNMRLVNGVWRKIWDEEFDNIVVIDGKDAYLDRALKTGISSPVLYAGLKGSGTVDPADVMSSHAGWAELNPYSNTYRPTWTPGTIASGSVDNSGSPAAFNINATATVYGAFMTSEHTVLGTSGILFGAGDFAAARALQSGDVLNVVITAQIS
jgi:hypothetical protein